MNDNRRAQRGWQRIGHLLLLLALLLPPVTQSAPLYSAALTNQRSTLTAPAPAAPAAIQNDEVRAIDLTVSHERTLSADEKLAYEELFRLFADNVYEMSNGAHKLRNIIIFDGGRYSDRTDIVFSPATTRSNALANNYGKDKLSRAGMSIEDRLGAPPVAEQAMKSMAGTLAHEFGHYFYGALDEYIENGRPLNPYSPGSPAMNDTPPNPCSLMSGCYGTYEGVNFSTTKSTAGAGKTNNAHYRVYKASGWETLARDPKDDPLVTRFNPYRGPEQIPSDRLYWPELADKAPPADEFRTVELPDAQASARSLLQITWADASVTDNRFRFFLVDVSKGMGDKERLNSAKTALKAYVDSAKVNDQIGIITFAETDTEIQPLTKIVDDTTKETIKTAIDGITLAEVANKRIITAADQKAIDALNGATSFGLIADRAVYVIINGAFTEQGPGGGFTGTGFEKVSAAHGNAGIPISIFNFNDCSQPGDFWPGCTTRQGTSMSVLKGVVGATMAKPGVYKYIGDGPFEVIAVNAANAGAVAGGNPALENTEANELIDALDAGDAAFSPRLEVNLGTARDLQLPVEQPYTTTIYVDATLDELDASFFFNGTADAAQITLTDPNGDPLPSAPECESDGTESFCQLVIDAPLVGTWEVSMMAATQPLVMAYAMAGVTWEGTTFQATLTAQDGDFVAYPNPVVLVASLSKINPIAGAGVTAWVEDPAGLFSDLTLKDDGNLPDLYPDDGLYSGLLPYDQSGDYHITALFDNIAGTAFYATAALADGDPITTPVGIDFDRYASYEVFVGEVEADDHGNTAETATPLPGDNTEEYGRLESAADLDIFRVVSLTVPSNAAQTVNAATTSATYMVRLGALTEGLAPKITVVKASGTLEFTPAPLGYSEYFSATVDVTPGETVLIGVAQQNAQAPLGTYAISLGELREGEGEAELYLFGEAPDQAVVGQPYHFTPGVYDPLGETLYFTATNLPAWLTLDTATGALSGTPTVADVGSTGNLVLSVSNGLASAALPPFILTVVATAAQLDDEPIFENPAPPTNAVVGERYYYDPGLFDPEGEPLLVNAANLPGWLSLDPITGILSGTPGAGDVGAAIGIVLTATETSGVSSAGVQGAVAGDTNVAANALPPIQVNNPNLPYSPSSILFCGLTTDTLAPKAQTLTIKPAFAGEQSYEAFVSTLVRNIEIRSSAFYQGDKVTATIAVSPLSPDEGPAFVNGLNERSIKFTLNGQNYTVPVKVFIGATCSDGQLPAPSLVLSRSKLEYGAFVGESIVSKPLKLEATYGTLRWTARADQPWVQLSAGNGQTVQTINVGIDSSQLTAAGQYTAKVTLTDQNNRSKEVAIIATIGKSKTESAIDLTALEVTQGIQNLLNEMPLVVDRPTFVRAHVRSNTGQPINNVTAKLEVRRGNDLLGTLTPQNEGGAITINPSPDRGQLNDSFWFELQSEWLSAGTITVKLVGDNQSIGCADLINTPNDCAATATFDRVMPTVPFRFYRASFPGLLNTDPRQEGTVEVSPADLEWARNVLLAYYPITEIESRDQIWSFADTKDAQTAGFPRLEKERKLAGEPNIHYYLFNRTNADEGCCGGAGGRFIAASEIRQGVGAGTIAQEYEHTFYNHAACGEIGDTMERRFPAYVHDRISEATSGPSAYYGFDRFGTAKGQRIYPPTTKSVMSYCRPTWISDWEYRDLLTQIAAIPYGDLNTLAAAQAGVENDVLIVRGVLNNSSSATIQSVTGAVATSSVAVPTRGAYTLRLEKANGELLASQPFDPDLIDPHQITARPFTLILPYKADPSVVKKVVVLRNGVVALGSKVGSATAPVAGAQLSLDSAQALLTVAFTSTDGDGDSITHAVAYSPDNGQSWLTLAEDWRAPTLVIDLDDLPGSTSNPQLRILANDGFYSAQTKVALPVAVPNHRPQAFILTPLAERNTAAADESIILEGAGWDREDGELSGTHLIWHSDQDGVLGTGQRLVIAADRLSPGAQTIWLEAVDSAGLSSVLTGGNPSVMAAGATQRAVTTDAAPVIAAPVANFDIGRDQPYQPPHLAVDGIYGVVAAGQSTTVDVAVRNDGDGGPLNWTVQPGSLPTWMAVNQSSGQTPATIGVTINASALANGVYSGTLTFQSPDALLDNSVTVPYEIMVQTPSSSQPLTVTKAGSGGGVVTSDPLRLECGEECGAEFGTGSLVTLTATPNGNSTFAGWSGACVGTASTCQLTMDGAKAVVATFTLTQSITVGNVYLPLVHK